MFKSQIVLDSNSLPMLMVGVMVADDGQSSMSAHFVDPNNFNEKDALKTELELRELCTWFGDSIPKRWQELEVAYKGYQTNAYAIAKLVAQMMIRELLQDSNAKIYQAYVYDYDKNHDTYNPVGCVSFSGYDFGVSLLHPNDKSYIKSLARKLARQDGFEKVINPKRIDKKLEFKGRAKQGKKIHISEAIETTYLKHFGKKETK